MATTLSTTTPIRGASRSFNVIHQCFLQTRQASLLRRPRRPYTFTQLITLSDGSAFLTRTTSPLPFLKTTKDIKNHPFWNPSSQKLLNVEEDEAGRLKAFRGRFGRGWDAESTTSEKEDGEAGDGVEEDSLLDLIAGFSRQTEAPQQEKKKAVKVEVEEEVESSSKRKRK